MTEEWRPVRDFPEYQVSTLGRVKSLNYNHTGEEGLLAPQRVRTGYIYCPVRREKKVYLRQVHRLVAEAFLENPNNLPEVDHINGNKSDNRLENLQWISRSGNCLKKTRFGLRGTNTGHHHISYKPDENKYRVVLTRHYKTMEKRFDTLEEAIAFRDSIL
jgi:hypothetical protein